MCGDVSFTHLIKDRFSQRVVERCYNFTSIWGGGMRRKLFQSLHEVYGIFCLENEEFFQNFSSCG